MLIESFKTFFAQPIGRFFHAIKHDFQFLTASILGVLTLKSITADQKEQVLERSVHTFELLIKIVILGIAANEMQEKINSNLLHDLMAEAFVILVFYVLFLVLYYTSNFFEYLLKNTLLTELGSRVWNVYVLLFIIMLQFTGVIDETQSDVLKNKSVEALAMPFFIVSSIHFLYIFIKLKRAQLLNKRSIVYCLYLMLFIAISLLFFTAIEIGLSSTHA